VAWHTLVFVSGTSLFAAPLLPCPPPFHIFPTVVVFRGNLRRRGRGRGGGGTRKWFW
jgi:hypothetical protein